MLLGSLPGIRFDTAGVRLLYRSEPRIVYASTADAMSEAYRFSARDVCRATGRVHRLGGLRGDGRDLYRRMLGIDSLTPEPRAVALPIPNLSRRELVKELDAADLVVPAFGYRLTTVPVFDAAGRSIRLAASGPVVDQDARLLTEDGTPLANVFGVGLGSDFTPWGTMAGEQSFHGQ
jgi:hypothetical protein